MHSGGRGSADPTSGGGGCACVVGVKEWMHICHICLCFTPSRFALISSTALYSFNSSHARECTTFTLHDLTDFYVKRITAHRIQINYHSCFHNIDQTPKGD